MEPLRYGWSDDRGEHIFELVHVDGTRGHPYSFGEGADTVQAEVHDFYIGTVPVTQALWSHIAGANPAIKKGADLPVENVSWDAIVGAGGFLETVNKSAMAEKLGPGGRFRLPSETEWEYAARGGPHWRDGFKFSGSDDVNEVAWYDRRHGDWIKPVAQKAPNQLGIYDMSGNVWEWCQDVFTPEVRKIPRDGSPFRDDGDERVLRGGCFHNWAVHCTVSKRYEIAHNFLDGCIGLRLVYAIP